MRSSARGPPARPQQRPEYAVLAASPGVPLFLVMRQVPRIPDVAGDAPEGPVQRNALFTYEAILQRERVHSTYCSTTRAQRLTERCKDYVNFKRTKDQVTSGSEQRM